MLQQTGGSGSVVVTGNRRIEARQPWRQRSPPASQRLPAAKPPAKGSIAVYLHVA